MQYNFCDLYSALVRTELIQNLSSDFYDEVITTENEDIKCLVVEILGVTLPPLVSFYFLV